MPEPSTWRAKSHCAQAFSARALRVLIVYPPEFRDERGPNGPMTSPVPTQNATEANSGFPVHIAHRRSPLCPCRLIRPSAISIWAKCRKSPQMKLPPGPQTCCRYRFTNRTSLRIGALLASDFATRPGHAPKNWSAAEPARNRSPARSSRRFRNDPLSPPKSHCA